METPLAYFSGLTDPRVERTREHRLDDILFIAIASVICGAESWNDMEAFGKSKEEWLRSFLHIDGKSMCGTRDAGNKSIVHMVSYQK
jgi:hypothetical protein